MKLITDQSFPQKKEILYMPRVGRMSQGTWDLHPTPTPLVNVQTFCYTFLTYYYVFKSDKTIAVHKLQATIM